MKTYSPSNGIDQGNQYFISGKKLLMSSETGNKNNSLIWKHISVLVWTLARSIIIIP